MGFFLSREHHAFIEDCLDGYIVSAAMQELGLDDMYDSPTLHKIPPLMGTYSKEDQYSWLLKLAHKLLNRFVKLEKGN